MMVSRFRGGQSESDLPRCSPLAQTCDSRNQQRRYHDIAQNPDHSRNRAGLTSSAIEITSAAVFSGVAND
jgi:hypothetical protein